MDDKCTVICVCTFYRKTVKGYIRYRFEDYEKEIVSGVIEEVFMQKEAVHIRHRSSDMPTYYFKINDTDVRVTPSIAREYKEGDVYNYIQYTRGEKVIGDNREYSLLWGIFALLMEILLGCTAVSYFRVSTKEEVEKEKEARQELPQPEERTGTQKWTSTYYLPCGGNRGSVSGND